MRLPPKLDRQKVLAVLLEARADILRDGWLSDYADERGRYRPRIDGEGWTLWNAIQTGTTAGYHARRVLEQLAGDNLPAWNRHPTRDPHQVIALVDKAIRALGGHPPRTQYRQRRAHGGGWTVRIPRGETRPISSQGSTSSGAVDIGSPASGLDSFRPNGVPAMTSNEVEEPKPGPEPLLLIAQDIRATFQHLLELQRRFAELAGAQFKNRDPLQVVTTSAELASRLENVAYQFSSQERIAKSVSALPATASES